MSVARIGGLFGSAYASPSQVVDLLEKQVGSGRVQLLRKGDAPARKRAYVILGVDALKRLSPALAAAHSTIIVLDCEPLLNSVEGMHLLDCERRDPADSYWSPRKIDFSLVNRHLRRKNPEPVRFTLRPVDTTSNLIQRVKQNGVLDRILTFAHKFSGNKLQRERVFETVFRYIRKEITLTQLERKLALDRCKPSVAEAYALLKDALGSKYVERLSKAMVAAHPLYEPTRLRELADRHGVDRFELNYVATFVRRRNKTVKRNRVNQE